MLPGAYNEDRDDDDDDNDHHQIELLPPDRYRSRRARRRRGRVCRWDVPPYRAAHGALVDDYARRLNAIPNAKQLARRLTTSRKLTIMVIMSDFTDSPSSSWPLSAAKARLTQLVDAALAGTPQVITRHGQDVVIVIGTKQYAEALGQQSTIAEFFAHSPLAGVDLDIERNSSAARLVDL